MVTETHAAKAIEVLALLSFNFFTYKINVVQHMQRPVGCLQICIGVLLPT